MATYNELRERFASDGLRARIEVAVCVKAHAILQEAAPSAERAEWAAAAFASTYREADRILYREADRILRYLLAANKDLTPAQFDAVEDAALQIKCDEAVDAICP
jgi:hypothetical protein